jgi:hypothetical protein
MMENKGRRFLSFLPSILSHLFATTQAFPYRTPHFSGRINEFHQLVEKA